MKRSIDKDRKRGCVLCNATIIYVACARGTSVNIVPSNPNEDFDMT